MRKTGYILVKELALSDGNQRERKDTIIKGENYDQTRTNG